MRVIAAWVLSKSIGGVLTRTRGRAAFLGIAWTLQQKPGRPVPSIVRIAGQPFAGRSLRLPPLVPWIGAF